MIPAIFSWSSHPLTLRSRAFWALAAVGSFHLAHEVAFCAPLILVFLFAMLQLARADSIRTALYSGWAVGLCIYGPQLFFFWSIFHSAAIVLWLILSSWLAGYLLLQGLAWHRLGREWGTLVAPALWIAVEYARGELYPLRFTWLSPGYLMPALGRWTGLYGAGGYLMLLAAVGFLALAQRRWRTPTLLLALGFLLIVQREPLAGTHLAVAGVQLEQASEQTVLRCLDELYAKHPDTPLFVLSEYTFAEPVPPKIAAWCASHARWLIVGGERFLDRTRSTYRNTIFVVGPDGKVVFEQAKSQPIQFFNDGLPADRQAVWNSPWGKIGLCICYDLSYTRVTDGLIRQGAQAIIVPTMDVEEWGAREHFLHARVAPVRAAEYGVPVFRLCSSGVSQAVSGGGRVLGAAPFPGQERTLAVELALPDAGHLPLDRFLVWPCEAFAVGLLCWQAFSLGRGPSVGTASPTANEAR